MPLIGERLNDGTGTRSRYVRIPPASSGIVANGRPLSAGAAHIIANNLSHLSYESVRPICEDAGPGTTNYQGRGFDGLDDVPPAVGTVSTLQADTISWDRRTGRKYPFYAVCDRYVAPAAGVDPGYGPRTVRAVVDCSGGAANSLAILAALTVTAAPPDLTNTPVVFVASVVAGGRTTVALSLATPSVIADRRYVRCRRDSTLGSTSALVLPLYLWVGWYSQNGSDAVCAIAAWESREF